MAKNLTQFEKIRKKRARKKVIKRVIYIICIFSVILFANMAYKNELYIKITEEIIIMYKNLKKGSGYPNTINSSRINSIAKIGKSILLVDDSIIYIFNQNGYKTLYQKHNLNNPNAISNSNTALIYEHLGKKFKIYSKIKKIFDKELEYPIYNAAIANDGKLALITGSNRFLSSLEVWDQDYKKIFVWNSSDKYITSVSFSPNNKEFVVISLEVKDVEYVSTVTTFNINNDEKVSEVKLNDEVIISAKYKKNNNIVVVGKRNSYVISNKGKIKNKYSYNGKVLNSYDNDLQKVILIFDNYEKEKDNIITVLDVNLNELGSEKFGGDIKNIDSSNRKLHILTDKEILEFSIEPKLLKTYAVDMETSKIISTPRNLLKIEGAKIISLV